MANFYRDNEDIQFLFRHANLGELAAVCEEKFKFSNEFDYAPANAEEAIQNYRLVLDSLGQLSADFIAPRAEDVDREGNTLNEDGSVTYAKGIRESLEKLAQAEVMGFTLPHRFGGLRSEPDRSGGLGLSLFVCDRGPAVHIRRLEDKLGIHGSPTCEIFFDNTPCEIIGERQRGLVTYVMALMNGARIGIAAQSMGIAEAAFRLARDYAASRRQFGVAIEKLPAVRDMLIDMKIAIEAGRALLYETSRIVDIEIGYAKRLEADSRLRGNDSRDKAEARQLKNESRKHKRYAGMLTPMSKYYCSEMCNRIAYDSIQVLGGSGYMQDYACERHARDARITTIYEGTSQLQIVAAVRGVCSGTAEKFIAELAQQHFQPEVKDLLEKLAEGTEQLKKSVAFVKENGNEYMDLYGRALVDIAIDLITGFLLCGQASTKVDMDVTAAESGQADNGETIPMKQRKAIIARRYITKNAPKIAALAELICAGDKSTFTDYEAVIGPVSELEN